MWRYKDSQYSKLPDGSLVLNDDEVVREFSNFAVLGFLKVMAGIIMSKKLKKYSRD